MVAPNLGGESFGLVVVGGDGRWMCGRRLRHPGLSGRGQRRAAELVPPGRPSDLAQAISNSCQIQRSLQAMGLAARARAPGLRLVASAAAVPGLLSAS